MWNEEILVLSSGVSGMISLLIYCALLRVCGVVIRCMCLGLIVKMIVMVRKRMNSLRFV